MDLIEIKFENIKKAREYLSSIGRLNEFDLKGIPLSQWATVIQFANQIIKEKNNSSNGLNQ